MQLLKFFILLFLSIQLSYGELHCNSQFLQVPNTIATKVEFKHFPNHDTYMYAKLKSGELEGADYEQYIQSTVEIFFEPGGPFGHIRLRVGSKVYSLNYIQSASIGDFNKNAVRSGHKGFVYKVDPQEIQNLEEELLSFYESSRSNNFPPFDAYSPIIKITKVGNELKYTSPSVEYANNEYVRAEIKHEAGQYFLEKNNYRFPIRKTGDDTYAIQSYSCISSAASWAKRFKINLPSWMAAKELGEMLSTNPQFGATTPALVIDYL